MSRLLFFGVIAAFFCVAVNGSDDVKPALLFDTGNLSWCLQLDSSGTLSLDACSAKTDVSAKSDKTFNEIKLSEDTFQLELSTQPGMCVGSIGCDSGILCPDGSRSAPIPGACSGEPDFPKPTSLLSLVNCSDTSGNSYFHDPSPILPPDGDDSLCVVTYRSKTCDNKCLRSDYFSSQKQPAVW
eukprot:CAMPEP_0118633724 /NCGR_PEP_ID=MMETSP0785-20121206/1152_1 /TAXON_ID=91992 /ORGANISM="Bolidomonas pacifica, Strain CCMP 1866" /LENGTH=183 /DNA_ID=CAMNT_0006524623 /DNA_START=79 /DNA_END=627 /DNA_ORIENTATION=+